MNIVPSPKVDQSRIRNSENAVSVSENEHTSALKSFLENASDEKNVLKWIEQIVHEMKLRRTNSENSAKQESTYPLRSAAIPSVRIEETREKQSFNTNRNSDISAEHRERNYESHDSLVVPKRIYLEKEMKFQRYTKNSGCRYNKTLSRSIDKPINEEMEASKDLFSKKDDSKFTYQKLKGDTLDRRSSDYKDVPKDFKILDISKKVLHLSRLKMNGKENKSINSGVGDPGNSAIQCELSPIIGHVLSEKSQTMKEANADQLPLSLETLKQTVLKLRKSLIESNKGTNRNGNVRNISRPEEYDRQVEKYTRKKVHAKNELERDMPLRDLRKSNTTYGYTRNVKKSANGWDDSRSAAEIFYLKRRASDLENASYSKKSNNLEDENEDKISYLKEITLGVKRDRKNNEEEKGLKLFQRAGFGELSFKILNDHTSLNTSYGPNSDFEFQNHKENELTELDDFNKSLLITNIVLNESSNMSDTSVLKDKFVNKNIRDENVQNSNRTKDTGVGYLLGCKRKQQEKKLLRIKVIDNNERNVLMTDRKKAPQNITGPGKMMTFQHRMGRRILQDSANKNQNLYENYSKFHKRANQINRFGKSFKRSQSKEEDENMEDSHDGELEKWSAAQKQKLDIGYYKDQEKEDGVQNYNDEEDETEDYENDFKGGERSEMNSFSGLQFNTENGYVRKRHVPVVQYFDYEEAANDEDKEMPTIAKVQFKRKDMSRGKSDIYPQKNNKQKYHEELKKNKKIIKNKTPKEEFIGNVNVPEISENETLNETSNPKDFPFRGEIKRRKENQGKDKLDDHRSQRDSQIWSDESSETLKLLDGSNKDNEDLRRLIFAEPLEYKLNAQGKLNAGAISDLLSNDLPLEERLFEQDNGLLTLENNEEDYEPQRNDEYLTSEDSVVSRENDLGTTFEELENTNAWEGPIREKSRLRGDHRMDLDSEEASVTRKNRFDGYSEGSRRNWYQKERDRIGDSEAEKKNYKVDEGSKIFDEPESQSKENKFSRKQPQEKNSAFHTADDRKSGSSYLALKSTDDMFKGGIEQSKPSEEKTSNGLISSQKTAEWKVIKGGDSSTYSGNDKINANKSPESRFQEPVIEADFIFKEEDMESPDEIACKKNKDCSRDKQSILNSKELMHESFVESLDWMNDFDDDDDRKIRFGRGLKSFQENKKNLKNIGFSYLKKVDVLSKESTFNKDSTVTNIITLPVEGQLQNLSTEQNFQLPAEHFNHADTYTTKIQHDYTTQNKIDTFFAHDKKPEIKKLRVQRETFRKDDLVNEKSKHKVRNNFNRRSSKFNKCERATFRNAKNRNRRNKYNYNGNYNNDIKRNGQWIKKYSPEGRHFQQSANKLKKRCKYSKNRKQLDDILKYTRLKEAEGESHKRLHNEADEKWHRPEYAFQYQSSQLKHHKENKPAYKKSSLSSYGGVPSILELQSKDGLMHGMKKRNIRSIHRKPHHHKKHKKRRRKHRKGKKHKDKPAGRTSGGYRRMEHRNRQFRRKRANMDYADWSHDSGYEKRSIFSPDASEDEISGYSLENDRRDFDGITQNVPMNHPFKNSMDFKRKNDQQLEEVSLGEKMQDHMKEMEHFENLFRKQNANEEMPDTKIHPKNNDAFESTENLSSLGITVLARKENEATDKNTIGFLATVLKFFGILQLTSDNKKCKCNAKNVKVEDEVRKIEEKTNVYPETTESIETKCFQNSENISISTNHNESNQNLQTKFTNKSQQKMINFDYIDKELKNTKPKVCKHKRKKHKVLKRKNLY